MSDRNVDAEHAFVHGPPTHVLTYIGSNTPSLASSSDDDLSQDGSSDEAPPSDVNSADYVRVSSEAMSEDYWDEETLERLQLQEEAPPLYPGAFRPEEMPPPYSTEEMRSPAPESPLEETPYPIPVSSQQEVPQSFDTRPEGRADHRHCPIPAGQCSACTSQPGVPVQYHEFASPFRSPTPAASMAMINAELTSSSVASRSPPNTTGQVTGPPPRYRQSAVVSQRSEIYRGMRGDGRTIRPERAFHRSERDMTFEAPTAPLNTLNMRSSGRLVRLGFDGADILRVYQNGGLVLSMSVDEGTRLEVERVRHSRRRYEGNSRQ